MGPQGPQVADDNVIDPRLLEEIADAPWAIASIDGPGDMVSNGEQATASSASQGWLALRQQVQQTGHQQQTSQPRPAQGISEERQDPIHHAPYLSAMSEYAENTTSFFDGVGYWFAVRHGSCPLNSRHRHDAWGGVLFYSAADAVAACAPIAPNQEAINDKGDKVKDNDWMKLLASWHGGGKPELIDFN